MECIWNGKIFRIGIYISEIEMIVWIFPGLFLLLAFSNWFDHTSLKCWSLSSILWCPDPVGTETSLWRIYAGRKYPHVYTLSISTGKNQSAEAHW